MLIFQLGFAVGSQRVLDAVHQVSRSSEIFDVFYDIWHNGPGSHLKLGHVTQNILNKFSS